MKRLLREVELVCESARRAQYKLKLLSLADGEGYVVAKKSGAAGSTLVGESWYRETLEQAGRKFQSIVRQKTTRKLGRQYLQVSASVRNEQLDLSLGPSA